MKPKHGLSDRTVSQIAGVLERFPVVERAILFGSRARGDYYSLPNVPYVMYFYRGYALHGTYWHRNFGHTMSHGCVNLTIADSAWFYNFGFVGMPVRSHY